MGKDRCRPVWIGRKRLHGDCKLPLRLLGDRQTWKHQSTYCCSEAEGTLRTIWLTLCSDIWQLSPVHVWKLQTVCNHVWFEHRTSSPYNSKSNGKAESAVKTAKSILRKNKYGDQFLALLNYRNTPSQSTGTSPAQRFFNRRTRTLLPTCETLLKPKLSLESDIQKLHSNQKKQKKNFDRRAKDLPPLEEGDAVVMQPHTHGKKKWSRATAISGSGRSYNVEAEDGTIYRRNRVHLKKIADQAPAPQPGSS